MRLGTCGGEPYDVLGQCLLHSDADKDDAKVRELVLLRLRGCEERGEPADLAGVVVRDLDLGGWTFETAVSFRGAHLLGKSDFSACLFRFEADFHGVKAGPQGGDLRFVDAVFEQDASFQNAGFLAHPSFRGARFERGADFTGARLEAGGDFLDASFGGKARTTFSRTTWLRGASFQAAKFQGEASFSSARFLADDVDVAFVGASFDKAVSFIRTEFHGPTAFHGVEFRDTVVFRETRMPGLLRFQRAEFLRRGIFEDLDLAPGPLYAAHPVRLDFTRVTVKEVDAVRFVGTRGKELDLSGVRFSLSETAKMRFENIAWPRTRVTARSIASALVGGNGEPGLRLRDEDFLLKATPEDAPAPRRPAREVDSWDDPDYDAVHLALHGWPDPVTHEHLAAAYKGLRQSYERGLKYSEAGEFHVREMEMRRLAPRGGPLRSFAARNLSLINLYRLVSRYGESYHRAGAVLAVVAAAFLAVRVAQGAPLAEAAWSTLVAFLALQLRSGARLDVVQALVGLPLLAFFGMALRRHFKR